MPSEKSIDTCFVISPFGEPYDNYFLHIFKPALEECGLYAERGDSLYRPSTIMDDIWDGIKKSKLLIAELTDRNPNVFYELGLAHAISKPVILISKSIDDIPFDLRSIRVLLYDKDHPNWGDILKKNLIKAINETLANPSMSVPMTFKEISRPATISQDPFQLRLESLELTVQKLKSISLENEPLTDEGTYYDRFIENRSTKLLPIPNTSFLHSKSLSSNFSLKVNDIVLHAKFGEGTILALAGTKKLNDLRAQINFEMAGIKWLALSVARLTLLKQA
jgi:hypothetical protein